jgi:uncharacterized membrane protein YdjX (TVP38/TMEM64 family)
MAAQKEKLRGWRIQILLRQSPGVPFGVSTYLLGLTKTSLRTYICATAVGILPGRVVDIYIGVVGENLAGGEQIAYLAVGVAVTVAVAVLIAIKAKSALEDAGVKA